MSVRTDFSITPTVLFPTTIHVGTTKLGRQYIHVLTTNPRVSSIQTSRDASISVVVTKLDVFGFLGDVNIQHQGERRRSSLPRDGTNCPFTRSVIQPHETCGNLLLILLMSDTITVVVAFSPKTARIILLAHGESGPTSVQGCFCL